VPGPDLLVYGPAPGVELIPQFLALLAWVGMAFLAVLRAPLSALLRRLRRSGKPPASPTEPSIPSPPESSGEGNPDRVGG